MIFSLVVLLASSLSAEAGRSTGAGLRISPGARASALGDAYTAAVDDASALYWNPAALALVKRHSVVMMHGAHLDNSYADYLAYAGRPHSKIVFGASLQHFSAGSIAQTDAAGADIGKFSPRDIAVAGGFSADLGWVSAGASGKYVRSSIITAAETMAADFGMISKPLLSGRLRMGAAVSNVGGKLRFDQDSEALELQVRLGLALASSYGLFAFDAGKYNEESVYAAFGYERTLNLNDDWKVTPRAGFNTRRIQFSGLAFGTGLTRGSVTVDYALLPFGRLGLTHRLSLSLLF